MVSMCAIATQPKSILIGGTPLAPWNSLLDLQLMRLPKIWLLVLVNKGSHKYTNMAL